MSRTPSDTTPARAPSPRPPFLRVPRESGLWRVGFLTREPMPPVLPDAAQDPDAAARDLVRVLRTETDASGALPPEACARRLYAELRRLARGHRARWRGHRTMNTTAIVHEAYVRLASGEGYASDSHFLRVASRAMRQVLVNYARDRGALKRGGGALPLSLNDAPEAALLSREDAEGILDLDRALDRLARMDPRAARTVELRVFGGLTLHEAADALGVSEATVSRDWRRARAWLRGELGGALPALPDA